MKTLDHCYEEIISPANLWRAWTNFRGGKRGRQHVRMFEVHLEEHLLNLRDDLLEEKYTPSGFRCFEVHDPKRRTISAPTVYDQLVHQAVWNVLFPFFNQRFSRAVYSSRPGQGTHAAIRALARIGKTVRQDEKRRVYVLHIDVVKFFDSVEHGMLRAELSRWISCQRTLSLLEKIIGSYDSQRRLADDKSETRRGIPLGSLTSQLFCNIVLMPFDHLLDLSSFRRAYARYADDCFVIATDPRKLDICRRACLKKMTTHGFACRARIRRFNGFEALGARFFSDGIGIRREGRLRARQKLQAKIVAYSEKEIGLQVFESSTQSLRGLPIKKDRRWTATINREILAASI